MKLILIRHGATEANEKRLYCGSTDLPLSASGAAALREKVLSGAYPCADGFRFVTSGLKRCAETLLAVYGAVAFTPEKRISEMDFGVFEMKSYAELKDDPAYVAWISGDNEKNVAPGGESGEMMKERVFDWLSEAVSENADTVAVTHGGVIAAIMDKLFAEEPKNRYEWQPVCGGGYVVDVEKHVYTAF